VNVHKKRLKEQFELKEEFAKTENLYTIEVRRK